MNPTEAFSDPIVSVIIPSYNREKLIVKAINSVMSQSFQDFEILIIDDASTDNTEQIVKDLKNNKIKYLRLDKNSGQCVARNYGIRNARGKYVAFLDSDDEWLPDKLRLQVDCFLTSKDKLGCVYGYAYQKDVIKNETILVNNGFYRGDIHDKFMEGFCPPTPSLFMVKKEALQEVDGFDERLITFVDLDLWLRLSREYHFDYIEEPLIIKYEQIGDQYINNFEKRYNGLGLFNKKWDSELKKKGSIKRLLKLKRRLVHALVVPLLEHPPKNLQKQSLKLIALLIKVRSVRWRLYIKSIAVLLFGPNIVYLVRNTIKKEKAKT